MNIYQQQILDHYHNPLNVGKPTQFEASIKLQNLTCGDEIEVYLNLEDNVVKKMHYNVEGCAISVASASLLSEALVGKSLEDVRQLDEKFMYELLGITLTPSRSKCAHLSLEAVQKALNPETVLN